MQKRNKTCRVIKNNLTGGGERLYLKTCSEKVPFKL